tara:strand:- start:113 stop:538 length:426 start_codon:yes stop_codon:yes gene_type:complete
MLTFFRRIRKGLLGQGGVPKYLLYAIGEIALVVIGILIALQINNWNEWRKDRIVEQELLHEVRNNIQMNVARIEDLHEFQKGCAKSCKTILDVMERRQNWSDSLNEHMEKALVILPPTLSFSSLESLKNRGFEIIQSKILR